MVPWYRSLYLRVFVWFWSVIFVAMASTIFIALWLEDDYMRPAVPRETLFLSSMVERKRPILIDGQNLYRRLNSGWNLLAVPNNRLSRLPHDIEEFVDSAINSRQVFWGQNDGWLLVGPILRNDIYYVAVMRHGWQDIFEGEGRWVLPATVTGIVTFLCFFLAWSLTKPLRRLQTTVRRLEKGDFDTSALAPHARRKDEIGELTADVVNMAASVDDLLKSHEQLIRDVSHELRSPLTRLQIALGIARKKDGNNDLEREFDRIERAANQVESLVADMLDLSRLQQERNHSLQRQPELLASCIDDWVANAELELADKSLTLHQTLADDLNANWDWLLMERVFDNLLRNAIRYSPEHGNLWLTTQLDGTFAEITLQDQGPGVPDDELQRIFEPFVQVDQARTPHNAGYGIGLAMVQRIIELHNGQVFASNCQPGLKVTLRLPINNAVI